MDVISLFLIYLNCYLVKNALMFNANIYIYFNPQYFLNKKPLIYAIRGFCIFGFSNANFES